MNCSCSREQSIEQNQPISKLTTLASKTASMDSSSLSDDDDDELDMNVVRLTDVTVSARIE